MRSEEGRPFRFLWHVRERILPALARLDGLEEELDEVLAFFDVLAARDLDFDLREGPPYPSNLCEADCAIELGYTFGGRDTCGVRYSYEPTAKRSFIKPRYTLCRDRLRAAMRRAGDGYDVEAFTDLFHIGVPRDVQLAGVRDDATVCIAAIHHYKGGRPPRLKAYFSTDYDDPARSYEVTRQLVTRALGEEALEQVEAFGATYAELQSLRMVGIDFEPGRPLEAKVYGRASGLAERGLTELIALAKGDAPAREGVKLFLRIFADGAGPEALNLIALAPAPVGTPRLKLYLRPVDHYGDAEALARLERWYRAIDRSAELESVVLGLGSVAPLDVLSRTRGFFNYVSVDVGPAGVTKTSVYFAPLIPLVELARTAPERLAALS